ncbi:hypothetical protein MPER_12682 [Moniliophthora perniciosa FA553]|nr:hypothetical protein MPER_12682 [Moniliophthora perniciosa FA553]
MPLAAPGLRCPSVCKGPQDILPRPVAKVQQDWVIIYVDDALFMGSNLDLVLKKKREFMNVWECRDLGEAKEFLGMRILRDRSKRQLTIDQSDYLKKVVKRFGMEDAKFANTPLPTGYKPTANEKPVDPELRARFQSVIGSILFLMLGTRPDIAYATIKLSQFAANPSSEHLQKALYIIRYLNKTRDYRLVYDGMSDKGLICFADSDWASDDTDRKSHSGYVIKLASAPVCWVSHKQKTVALSSTEAEYMSLSDASRPLCWIKLLFGELKFPIHGIPLVGDNQGSIFLTSNCVVEKRSKHIDIRFHFIRDKVDDGTVVVFYTPTDQNVADIFTKNLPLASFIKFRSRLGLEFANA